MTTFTLSGAEGGVEGGSRRLLGPGSTPGRERPRGCVTDALIWFGSRPTLLGAQRSCHDFAMPILADALQDAGCDSDDTLNHCRGRSPHVRGCWVVDLLLDRT